MVITYSWIKSYQYILGLHKLENTKFSINDFQLMSYFQLFEIYLIGMGHTFSLFKIYLNAY
jgi:hypothetical protein